MRARFYACASLILAMIFAGASAAQTTKAIRSEDYGRDQITVASADRHNIYFAGGDCVVWENAEGLGVKFGDLHGLSMDFNPHPIPGEQVVRFETAMALLHRAYPDTPAWMFATLEKNRTAIEAACATDHPIPVRIYTLTERDKTN